MTVLKKQGMGLPLSSWKNTSLAIMKNIYFALIRSLQVLVMFKVTSETIVISAIKYILLGVSFVMCCLLSHFMTSWSLSWKSCGTKSSLHVWLAGLCLRLDDCCHSFWNFSLCNQRANWITPAFIRLYISLQNRHALSHAVLIYNHSVLSHFLSFFPQPSHDYMNEYKKCNL